MTDSIQRIQNLIESAGLSAKKIFSELEISTNAMTEWKKGKAKPSTDAIIKLAKYFNVTTDYLLLGKTDLTADLSMQEKIWLDLYQNIPLENRSECIGFVRGYTYGVSSSSVDKSIQKNVV